MTGRGARGRWRGRVRPGSAVPVLAALAVIGVAIAAEFRGRPSGRDPGPTSTATSASTSESSTTSTEATNNLDSLPPPTGRIDGRLALVDSKCRLREVDLRSGGATSTDRFPLCFGKTSPNGRYVAYVDGFPDVGPVRVLDRRTGSRWNLGGGGLLQSGGTAITDAGVAAVAVPRDSAAAPPRLLLVSPGGVPRTVLGSFPATIGKTVIAIRGAQAVDLATGRPVAPVGPRAAIGDVALGSGTDGHSLVATSRDEVGEAVATVFDARGRRRLLSVPFRPNGAISELRLSPAGDVLAVRVLRFWLLVRLTEPVSIDASGGEAISDVAFSPSGRYAALVTSHHLVIVDARSFGPLAALRLDLGAVNWLPGRG